MRMWKAMLIGSTMGKQLYWHLWDKESNKDGCAIGAAFFGAGGTHEEMSRGRFGLNPISEKFPVLRMYAEGGCPVPGCVGGNENFYIWDVIAHLNNEHKWTREAIADWLRPIESKLMAPKKRRKKLTYA